MLLSKDAIADVVEVIRGTDFYRPAHELIYDAVLDLYGRGEPADAITVSAELTRPATWPGSAGRRTSTPSSPASRSRRTPATTPASSARRRSCAGLSTPAPRSSRSGMPTKARSTTSSTRPRPRSTPSPTSARPRTTRRCPTSWSSRSTSSRRSATATARWPACPTGFAELDELTNGLHGGQMVIVAARPAVGKSTLRSDFARSASIKHGLTSAIFSLEMSKHRDHHAAALGRGADPAATTCATAR